MKPSLFAHLITFASIFAFFFVAPNAHAQNSCQSAQENCDEGEAYALCKAALDWTKDYRQNTQQLTPNVRAACTHPTGSTSVGYFFCDVGATSGSSAGCYRPSSTTRQDTYHHNALCTSRPSPGSNQVREWTSRCVGGCRLEVKNGASVTFSVGESSFTESHGDLEYTGVCPGDTPNTPDDAGPDKEEECKPVGSLTMCLKGNGDQCLVASSGKKFCWTPGQPSNEVNGNDAVSTDPTAPAPPNAPPQDGTGWKPPMVPAPTTNSTGGPTGPRSTVVSVTTSVGTGSNGGGGTDPPGGDDDCDPATETCPDAGGGQTCGAPPNCTGDPINCQVLFQAWKTRCAVEGSSVAPGSCGGPAPTCTGSNVLCAIAERERLHKCDLAKQQSDYAASLDVAAEESDGLEGVEATDIFGESEDDDIELDQGIFGGSAGGTCAASLTLGRRQFVFPSEFYLFLSWLKVLLIFIAYIWAAEMVIK